MTLAALYRFPVKSLRGERRASCMVGRRGLDRDRHWMVVDTDGRFLTQRQQPRMCLIDTAVAADGGLRLFAPGMGVCRVSPDAGRTVRCRVWSDDVAAIGVDAASDRWLSAFLGTDCRLVRLADDGVRPVDPAYAATGDQVGFADGFPFLLISAASLADLNTRLAQPVGMIRFRPNLVVSGCAPYAEDSWTRIRIGDIRFRVAKPCSRCVIPTIDTTSAVRSAEPLRTLLGYRRRDNKVYFGQNLLHDGGGRLEIGMPVEVLE